MNDFDVLVLSSPEVGSFFALDAWPAAWASMCL